MSFPYIQGDSDAVLWYLFNDQRIAHIEVATYPEEAALDWMCISHLSSFNLTAFTKASSVIKRSAGFEFGVTTRSCETFSSRHLIFDVEVSTADFLSSSW